MGLWAAVAQRDYLLGNTGHGDHPLLYVVREVAYPVAILTELGIIIAAIAQAMQCIIVSPRLLQVLACLDHNTLLFLNISLICAVATGALQESIIICLTII